ncbi:MAG: alkaline phosphatase family protein [Spirochaetaceae bacterium]
MRKLLFIFLDGVGLGSNTDDNPMIELFSNITGEDFILEKFPKLTDKYLLKPIDAILDIKGTPQSATGQTSILTGISGQGLLGHHHTAFPNPPLIELIKEHNMLLTLKDKGLKVTCANMYSKEYFKNRESRSKNMLPVSALSVIHAEIDFKFLADYNKGEAVFADITNNVIRARGYDIDIITPEEAAKNMLNICEQNDFVFFEYFITDSYGHKKNREKLLFEVQKLNKFIGSLWNSGNNNIDIILTSDHGNSEDISTGNHTKNPVPFLYLSENMALKELFLTDVTNITHFKPGVLKHFNL